MTFEGVLIDLVFVGSGFCMGVASVVFARMIKERYSKC